MKDVRARSTALMVALLVAAGAATLRGQGTYAGLVTFPAGNGASAVKHADIDGDGDNDLFVAASLDNTVTVLLNDGAGNLTNAGALPVGIGPAAIAIADMDGNGTPDIVTANLGSDDVSIALNNGAGFNAAIPVPAGLDPFALAIGDVDGNGLNDVVTANFLSHNATLILNQGGGVFTSVSTPFLGAFPSSVVLADLDRDGDLDLAIAYTGFGVVGVYGRTSTGNYTFDGFLPVGLAPVDLHAIDVDFDGSLELVSVNLLSNDVSVLPNLGQRVFGPAMSFPVGNRPVRLARTQSDNALGVDLATIDFNDFSVSVLRNNTSATFASNGPSTLIALTPSSITSCDMNGDFYDDLIVTSFSQDNVAMVFNQAPAVPYPGTNEDLQLLTGVNAPVTGGPGAYIKTARGGDQLAVSIVSQNGTLTGTPVNLGVQLGLEGFPPVPGLPGLWLNGFGFGANIIYTSPALAPGGESIVAPMPAGLVGLSIVLQAFAYHPAAANGIITTTDAYEVRFLP